MCKRVFPYSSFDLPNPAYTKTLTRPSNKSFLISDHILVLKVSKKFINLANQSTVKAYAERECSKLFVV